MELKGIESFCLYVMSDGTIECRSCDHPPDNSTYLRSAPEGLVEGSYQPDDPRLSEGKVAPEGGEV